MAAYRLRNCKLYSKGKIYRGKGLEGAHPDGDLVENLTPDQVLRLGLSDKLSTVDGLAIPPSKITASGEVKASASASEKSREAGAVDTELGVNKRVFPD